MEKSDLPRLNYGQYEGNEYHVNDNDVLIRVVRGSSGFMRKLVQTLAGYAGSSYQWDDTYDYHAFVFTERVGQNWGFRDYVVGVLLMRNTGQGAGGWILEWSWFFDETASTIDINGALTLMVSKFPPSFLVKKPIDTELNTVLVARGVNVDVEWPVVT